MTYVDPWGEAPAFVYATQAASMIVASAPERMQSTDSVAGASAWAAVALVASGQQQLANMSLDQQVVFGLVTGGGFGLVRSRLARVGATGARSATRHGLEYAARVRARAVQDPVSHNFPYSFDDEILSTTPEVKASGYKIFRKEGTMTGSVVTDPTTGVRSQQVKEGVFEIGVTPDGVIDHRFFRPDGG